MSALITLITVLPGVLADCVLVLDIEGDSEEFEVDRASGTGVTEVEHRGSSVGLLKGVTGDANNIPISCAPPWTAESGMATCAFAFSIPGLARESSMFLLSDR